jgi:apolipoprotein N-acyltransferase
MLLKDILLAALSGILLVLAFPQFNLEFLSWIALIPWLWSIRKKSPPQAAFLGFVAGVTFFAGLLYWIYNVLTEYGHLPGWISIFFLLLLISYLALYFSLFSYLLRWINNKTDLSEIFFAPPLWISLEYVRGFLLSGFPWELLGYSQFQTLPIVQIADITGVYGVSFIILLANVALYRLAISISNRSWKTACMEILLPGIIILLAWTYGLWRLSDLERKAKPENILGVALIQGNIRQDIKWEPEFQQETLKIYSNLTLQVKGHRPDLIIWPETATPFFFQNSYPFQTRILELTHQMEAPLLFGAPAFQRKGPRVNYFNSAFLISADKKIVGRYDKIHLVPFGEYAPLSGILGFTRDIIGAIGDFTSGEDAKVFSLPRGSFGVLICYEVIFPNLTRQFVAEDAQFLVNITNDAWFGKSSAPYQHLSMATLRAIENRVPIARAANTGISALIAPSGKIVQSSGLFTREVLFGTINLNRSSSFYTQWGDLFSYLCMSITVLLGLFTFFKRNSCVERSIR